MIFHAVNDIWVCSEDQLLDDGSNGILTQWDLNKIAEIWNEFLLLMFIPKAPIGKNLFSLICARLIG